MMNLTTIETFYPANVQEWRSWLSENHLLKQSIWVVFYKKKSNKPSISWSEAVDEALCFGWIDSTARSVDEEKFIQYFSKRKLNSAWSKINKEKVQRLITGGLMMPAGFNTIQTAKQNGSWVILDLVEELVIPADLKEEFETKSGSKEFFLSLSKSVKKAMLQWISLAKLEETRRKRVLAIAELASKKLKPKQFN